MSEPRRITSEDLALFAMQLLPKEEAAEVAAYVAQSADARKELAEIQGDLAIYAHTVDLHSPPAQVRERLMKQVAREKKTVPIDRPAVAETRAPEVAVRPGTIFTESGAIVPSYVTEEIAPKRGIASRALPWVGWALAAGLALTAGKLYRDGEAMRESMRGAMSAQANTIDRLTADVAAARQVAETMTDSSAMRVTLTKGKTAAVPQGKATYVASKGALIFTASNLEPLQPGKTYELWLIPAAAGVSPIPAGTFRPDERGNASVIMPTLPKGVEAKAFGVTVENEGGATTPTQPILLAGE
ncbi:MAG TPA: anti-sigma factor [Edaphobacter sp.]|jgi:anti-sigma-K factor RskA|nr:anti-sigma factor [Edaphobacter sp.]